MDIAFERQKLRRAFNSDNELKKAFGERVARSIAMRMAVLRNAATLSLVPTTPPDRCHQLKGKRAEQFAVDLVHPHRLVFRPNHNPMPRKGVGGIDKNRITAITVIEVVDYHH